MAFDDLDVNAFFDFDAATDEEMDSNDKSNGVDTVWSMRDPSEILALLPSTSMFLVPLNDGAEFINPTPPVGSSSGSSRGSLVPPSVPNSPQTTEPENIDTENAEEASGGSSELDQGDVQSAHQAQHTVTSGETSATLAYPSTRSMGRLAAMRLATPRAAGSDKENATAVEQESTTESGSQRSTATKRTRSRREREDAVAGPSSVTLDDMDADPSSDESERPAPKKSRHRRTRKEVAADEKKACTATQCGLDGGCRWALTDDTRKNKKHLRDAHYAQGRSGATVGASTSSGATQANPAALESTAPRQAPSQSAAPGTLRCSWGTAESQCGRTYSGATPLANLERHIEGHHWGRQLVCDQCGQAFDRVWLLTRHKKSCGKGKSRNDKDAGDEGQPPQKKRRL